MENKEKIAVSACLVGKNVKYDGTNNYNQDVIDYIKDKEIILICPEVLGGLTIPRIPCEIINGKVINQKGIDLTQQFANGANKALEMVLKNNIKKVILKANSPSCGYKQIYDGSFSHKTIPGNGIFANLLSKYNIEILTELDLKK